MGCGFESFDSVVIMGYLYKYNFGFQSFELPKIIYKHKLSSPTQSSNWLHPAQGGSRKSKNDYTVSTDITSIIIPRYCSPSNY